MREFRTSGSVRGAASNGRPYRELISRAEATGMSGWLPRCKRRFDLFGSSVGCRHVFGLLVQPQIDCWP
jgi:hypothetical protein